MLKASCEIIVEKLIGLRELELEAKGGKKVAKISFIAITVPDTQRKQQSSKETIVPRPPSSPTEVHLIYLCVSNCELFSSALQRNLYKIALKLACQRFESASQQPSRPINLDVICPILGKLDEFLCLELWRSAVKESLEAVGKLLLSGINLMLKKVGEESVGPIVVADSKVTLVTLTGDNTIGYLDVLVCIGTPRQINWQRAQQIKR